MPFIGGIFTVMAAAIRGWFGTKQAQIDAIDKGIKVVGSISGKDAKTAQAAGQALKAEIQSERWLAAMWRPILMTIFASILVSRWFGYTPSEISEQEVQRLYDLLELGIGGYIGGRTLEKLVQGVMKSKLLDKFLSTLIK